jgi:uncharacterized protein (TIGR02217 family)
MSFGSVGGPERRTDIVTLSNGHEERNSPWAHSRRRWDAGVGMRSLDDVERLIAFFEARHGQMFGFRWKDWSDYKSCAPSGKIAFFDQVIGIGDGATKTFQLSKLYASGPSSYTRPIQKPVEGTLKVGVQDEERREGEHFTVDYTTGQITFVAAPPAGLEVKAGFEFDVPVRFDTDRIHTNAASFAAGDIPNVPVVEVRL